MYYSWNVFDSTWKSRCVKQPSGHHTNPRHSQWSACGQTQWSAWDFVINHRPLKPQPTTHRPRPLFRHRSSMLWHCGWFSSWKCRRYLGGPQCWLSVTWASWFSGYPWEGTTTVRTRLMGGWRTDKSHHSDISHDSTSYSIPKRSGISKLEQHKRQEYYLDLSNRRSNNFKFCVNF